MNHSVGTQVLIVGAGPVGLTLAMDLASRGIEVLIIETRERLEPPSVKCNHVSARSMEIFRRLGVANRIRAAGLPGDYPHDVSYRTTTTGIELTRIPIPSRNDRPTAMDGPDTWWPTAEPPHRINQIFLEPILFEYAESMPGITIINRSEVVGFDQDDDGVTVHIVNHRNGETQSARCEFLIGCDGGRSLVRKNIGAKFIGDAVIQRVQSTYIRAPQLLSLLTVPPSWAMFSMNPRRSGNVYSIDGRETWLVHNYLRDDEPDFDSVDRDHSIREILGVGADFQYEEISKEDWFGRRLVADKLREGRVFICGDAAHLWVPYAGYGMNAGIADAANLAWLMSAHLAGWAPIEILDTHFAERHPITEQVSRFAMNHAHELAKSRKAVPDDIEAQGPEGENLRRQVGEKAYALNVQQYCCGGLNFGYFYDHSPIISYDGEPAPDYSMADFTPSTVPGCRVPYFALGDGTPLYDRLGPDFSLLRFNRSVPVDRLLEAAQSRGIPMVLIDLDTEEVPSCYREKLVIARPDQHVGWRGNKEPEDPDALIGKLTGAFLNAPS